MIKTENLVGSGWVDVFTTFGFVAGTSLVIHNPNSQYLYVSFDALQEGYIRVDYNESIRIPTGTTTCFVKCDGYVSVYEDYLVTTGGIQAVTLPDDLYTDSGGDYRRIRVEVGESSFFAGREFRMFHEFSIPTGQSIFIKAAVSDNIILHETSLTLDVGDVKLSLFTGGTESTPFTTPITPIKKNTMTGVPNVVSQVAFSTGGTHTGGNLIDVHRMTSNSVGNRSLMVGGKITSQRGVGPGNYFYKLENVNGTTSTGVFSGWWEERPNIY